MVMRRILVIALCAGFTSLAGAHSCVAASNRVAALIRYLGHADLRISATLGGRSGALAARLAGSQVGPGHAPPRWPGDQDPRRFASIGSWSDRFGWPDSLAGFDGGVSCAVSFRGRLVVGGWFTGAAGVPMQGPAGWNGSSWEPVGGGVGGSVYAATVWNDKLIVAGDFTSAGGEPANGIAAWDGIQWTSLGLGLRWDGDPSVSAMVTCLAVHDGLLYAGGWFNRAGDVVVGNLARWDGSAWGSLSGGDLGTEGLVLTLHSYSGRLIAGGVFETAGSIPCRNVAAWDGSSWNPLGDGVDGIVFAVEPWAGGLVVAGLFDIREVGAHNAGFWDGGSWGPMGGGTDDAIQALTVHDGALVAGGGFRTAGGLTTPHLARWDGASWDALGAGANAAVLALVAEGDSLIAAGDFTRMGGKAAGRVALRVGAGWNSIGPVLLPGGGLDGPVLSLALHEGSVLAAGTFRRAGGIDAAGIASWDGLSWSSLGSGMQGMSVAVHSLCFYQGLLIAGGQFDGAGGHEAANIAAWNGEDWQALGSGIEGGLAPSVAALATDGHLLFAAGRFTTAGDVPAANVAVWDGSVWSPLGTGIDLGCSHDSCTAQVSALALYDTLLVAGGTFRRAGGQDADNLASWDGDSWSPIGGGVDCDSCSTMYPEGVYALTATGSTLIAGGRFSSAGAVPAKNVATWSGTSWFPLGDGLSSGHSGRSGAVLAVASQDGRLVSAGSFTHSGLASASDVAIWNGSLWEALGNGTDGPVQAVASTGSGLYMGGRFLWAGGRPSAHLGEWISSDQSLGPFSLLAPANAESVITSEPMLRWQGARSDEPGDSVRYTLYWSSDPAFAAPDSAATDRDTTYAFGSGTLQLHQTYYWKVRAHGEVGGRWSDPAPGWSFFVEEDGPPLPDLTVEQIDPDQVVHGSPITVSIAVANRGDVDCSSTLARVSVNGVPICAGIEVPAIPARTTVVVACGIGTYEEPVLQVEACADVAGAVIEAQEANNCLSDTIVVTGGECSRSGQVRYRRWEWVTVGLAAADLSAPTVFASLLPNLAIVKDDVGHVYLPGVLDNLSPVDLRNAYQIFLRDREDTLSVRGVAPDSAARCLSIAPHVWNLIPYLNDRCSIDCSLNISDAMASIAERVVIVKDSDGRVWIPALGINTIGHMSPLHGYYVFLGGPGEATLCYRSCLGGSASSGPGGVDDRLSVPEALAHYQPYETGLPDVVLCADIPAGTLEEGDEVALYSGEVLAGASAYHGNLPFLVTAWRSDPEHGLPGYVPDDVITAESWSKRTGHTQPLVLETGDGGQPRFVFEPYVSVRVLRPAESVVRDVRIADLSPNPTRGRVEIHYRLPAAAPVGLEIYDVSGRVVRTWRQGQIDAGTHSQVWDGRDASGVRAESGIYFVRLVAGSATHHRQLLVLR